LVDVRLPGALQSALAELTAGSERMRATALSSAYRAHRPSSVAVTGSAEAAAYAATRMPATYAAIATALAATIAQLPAFAPSRLLDAGAGPGTATWAAAAAFPGLERAVQLDHNRALLAVGAALAQASPVPRVEQRLGELAVGVADRFDLVVAGYALTELPDVRLLEVARDLWAHCDGVLVLVEPGRTRDYERLMRVRAALLEAGARIVAPCPHERPCPLPSGDWCHFSVRLPRLRGHRQAKGGTLGYEDEKFSYLAVARPALAAQGVAARIIRPPIARKFEVELPVCTAEGLAQWRVPKRDAAAFKAARKLAWGDAVALVDGQDEG